MSSSAAAEAGVRVIAGASGSACARLVSVIGNANRSNDWQYAEKVKRFGLAEGASGERGGRMCLLEPGLCGRAIEEMEETVGREHSPLLQVISFQRS